MWKNKGELIYFGDFCKIFSYPRTVLVNPWLLVIQYGFIFAVPALEYLFPLAAGFLKAELRFLILFV